MKSAKRKRRASVFSLFAKSLDFYRKVWLYAFPFMLVLSVFWKSWRIWGIPRLSEKLHFNLYSPVYSVDNYLYETMTVLLVTFLLFLILASLSQAYLTLICDKHHEVVRAGFLKLLSHLYSRLFPLAFVTGLLFFFLDVGFASLIIPGIILAYFFQFAVISVIVENRKGFDAFRHSYRLVRHNFSYLLTTSLAVWAAIYLLHFLTRKMLVTSITYQSFVLPFFLVYFYFLYRELTPRM